MSLRYSLFAAPAAMVLMAAAPAAPVKMPNGTIVREIKVGKGRLAAPGDSVTVHYTGWLYADGIKGKKFDSSVDRGEPFVFPLGLGAVITGWDEGVAGMNVGGKRELIIPPAAGYGERGAGADIPPNATLLFEVELLAVE
jgi:FKBP-type peptidyl-prolyl cis-trans isomerase